MDELESGLVAESAVGGSGRRDGGSGDGAGAGISSRRDRAGAEFLWIAASGGSERSADFVSRDGGAWIAIPIAGIAADADDVLRTRVGSGDGARRAGSKGAGAHRSDRAGNGDAGRVRASGRRISFLRNQSAGGGDGAAGFF